MARQTEGREFSAVNIFRRLSLSRLLLVCALAVAVGVSATALAFAVGSGPTPPAKPLAAAIHDALVGADGTQIEGVSASVTLTDHLLEGASLASGGGQSGELTSNPLITGASGRLWIAKGGDVRLELQAEQGDTQILYDGHTLQLYDAATNTLYRYTPPAREAPAPGAAQPGSHEVPSLAKIEEAIAHVSKHAELSGATPTDVAGQPAYTVRVTPNESGSLLGGVELSFDANNGVPLRTAIYSTSTSAPVIELAATEISYGPVAESVFAFSPPPGAKIEEVKASEDGQQSSPAGHGDEKPKLTSSGHGVSTIGILESKDDGGAGKGSNEPISGLPKVSINGVSASELRTELGTLLTFERSGVRYVLAGSVAPGAIEAVARGL
jgi:outer membrane lipoprotein-sorting protein